MTCSDNMKNLGKTAHRCLFAIVFFGLLLGATAMANAATLTTDRADYAPGETVLLTGSGFQSGESVVVQVVHADGTPAVGESHDPWTVEADASGSFETTWIVPHDDNIDETLLATADGASSGLHAEVLFTDANTVLSLTSVIPDTICPGNGTSDVIAVCARLVQPCGGNPDAGLEGRQLIFFFNLGNCGVNVGQNSEDTVYTDANGEACANLKIPSAPGKYTIRVKFRGEDKPSPCPSPGNSACSPDDPNDSKRCVRLSASNVCEPVVVDPAACCEPPVLICPEDLEISCNWVGVIGDAHLDGDTAGVTIILTTDSIPGNCPQQYMLVRTWIALNDCGEADTCSQTITVIDDTPPTIVCPDPVTYDCDSLPNVFSQPTATDNCDANPSIRRIDSILTPGSCPQAYELTFVWEAMDACGNADTCSQSIRVWDTTPPVIACPDPLTLDCGVEITLLPPDATDNCDSNVTVVLDRTTSNSDGLTCPIVRVNHYFWVATDECGNADTCDQVIYHIDTIAPECTVPETAQYYLCYPGDTVCFEVSAFDVCDTLVECRVTDGPGAIADGQWCYTATGTSNFWVHIACTDDCGNTCNDSVYVTIRINEPPFVEAPPDTTIFLCEADTICLGPWPEIDFDNNILRRYVHYGWMQPPFVCFYADTPGVYLIDCCVEDSCGAFACDTTIVVVKINTPPVCIVPNDTAIVQCDPAPIQLPYGAIDAEDNFIECTIADGPGKLVDGYWIYTPTVDTSFCVVLWCFDDCETYCVDTFCVSITVNEPPECKLPNDTTIVQCRPEEVCLPVGIIHPPASAGGSGGDVVSYRSNSKGGQTSPRGQRNAPNTNNKTTPHSTCEVISGPGTVTNGFWCYTPPEADTAFTVTVRCYDSCGAYCEGSFNVNFEINQKPICIVPNDTTIYQCAPDSVCLPFSGTDPDGNLWLCRELGTKGAGLIDNYWCYKPKGDETVEVIIECLDYCGVVCLDTFVVRFEINDAPTCEFINRVEPPPCPSPQVPLFFAFTTSDPNGDSVTCRLEGDGTLDGNIWTYDSVLPGDTIYARIICADTCGAACTLTIDMIIPQRVPPVCVLPDDQTRFQCTPEIDSLPVYAIGGACSLVNDSPGELRNGWWVYTPSGADTVTVYVECASLCDTCSGSFTISYDINRPPVCWYEINAEVVNDTAHFFFCDPKEICIYYGASDPDGNLVGCAVLSNKGTREDDSWCMTPTIDEVIEFVFECVDECGATCTDTLWLDIKVNEPPVCGPRNDSTIFLCEPTEICFDYYSETTDADGNLSYCYLTGQEDKSGQAFWCFTPEFDTTVEFIVRCVDDCGAFCEDTFSVTFDLNEAPVCSLQTLAPPFCTPQIDFVAFTSTDFEDGATQCTLYGPGELIEAGWQYSPIPGEQISVRIVCVDNCGDSCVITFERDYPNPTPPICILPSDTTILVCGSEEVCLPVWATGGTNCIITSGPGTLVDSMWCFTPTVDTIVTVEINCTAICASCNGSFTVTFEIDQAPQIVFDNDSLNVFQCNAETICLPYTLTDPETSEVTVTVISGPGTANTAKSQVCFTPGSGGVYTIIVEATDDCGTSRDTIVVVVAWNTPPVCVLPSDTSISLCDSVTLCLPVSATDSDGHPVTCAVTAGPGTVTNGNWCYTITEDGIYEVTITCTDSCGATCEGTFTVTVDLDAAAPICDLPNDTTILLCAPGRVCIPLSAYDPNGQTVVCVLAGGRGEVNGFNWCYDATIDEEFDVIIRCTNECGAYCIDTFTVLIDINNPPKLDVPEEVLRNTCGSEEICIPITFMDPNDNLDTCRVIEGPGTIVDGQWCYTPSSAGTYDVRIECIDDCGAVVRKRMRVTVIVNTLAVCALPPSQDIILCDPGQLCLSTGNAPFATSGVLCQLIDGPGVMTNNIWCLDVTEARDVSITVRCTDQCDNTCQTTRTYSISINPENCGTGPASLPRGDNSITMNGDLDGSGTHDVFDLVQLIGIVFQGNPSQGTLSAGLPNGSNLRGDVNCDGRIDASDVVYLGSYIFQNGASPCVSSAMIAPSQNDTDPTRTNGKSQRPRVGSSGTIE